MRGLGFADALSSALFPVAGEVSQGMDPRTTQALQQQALMQLGLGMLAARERGAGLGQGTNQAFLQAQQGLGQGLNHAFLSRRAAREDQRLDLAEDRLAQQDERAATADARATRAEQRGIADAALAQRNWERTFAAQAEREAESTRQRNIDNSFQQRQYETALARIEAEENRRQEQELKTTQRFESSTRKEFNNLQSVKDLKGVLPVLQSAKNAPNTGAGDLQMIYSVGKILDPGSVVREGELKLTLDSADPVSRLFGQAQFVLKKGGRLTPEMRAQFMDMLDQRVGAYRQAYEQDFNQYGKYASEQGLNAENVVGRHLLEAYGPQVSAAAPTTAAAQQLDALMGQYGSPR